MACLPRRKISRRVGARLEVKVPHHLKNCSCAGPENCYDEVVASHETLTEKVASNRLRQSSQEKTVDDDWRSMRTYRVTGRPVGSTVAKKNSGDYDIQEERSPFTIFS
ncbi:uncharacterized protein PHALS_05896 [Plasmopara halstedii]|uniref:Uncharacterized protein n=1 Tax=Plasmopara halstedii TaxID=4781 RepID=A0A0N7L469_PLAHL|nr:uncharacterized protein PHALS_05896 [Plasmopara halstedii]CEG37843.1 hypothetical protein PHALS_05896 [Plasmopara halstedii]|eukprot:XP_024574212.1 hypothetical protein PHALS_05896 [Plasmopara halstedii]